MLRDPLIDEALSQSGLDAGGFAEIRQVSKTDSRNEVWVIEFEGS